MNIHPPSYTCSHYITVEHWHLRLYGIDMTQHAKRAFSPVEPKHRISEPLNSSYMPEITMAGDTDETIEIVRSQHTHNGHQTGRILVDRETGYVIEPSTIFSDISKFDPHTFPETPVAPMEWVGYWNRLNAYVPPKDDGNSLLL